MRRVALGRSASPAASGNCAGSTTRASPSMSASSRSSVVVNAASTGPRRPQMTTSRTPDAENASIAWSAVSVAAQVVLGEQQHPGDVERDVARADHDRALGVEVGVEVHVVGVAVVPTDEVDGGEAAGPVLAGDAEAALGLRADRVDHRVVALQQLLDGHVLAQAHVAEEPESRARGDLLVLRAHRLDLGVVGGDARAHQTPRCGEPVEHVDADRRVLRVQQRSRRVEPRGPRTDDGHGVRPHGSILART